MRQAAMRSSHAQRPCAAACQWLCHRGGCDALHSQICVDETRFARWIWWHRISTSAALALACIGLHWLHSPASAGRHSMQRVQRVQRMQRMHAH
ncbi:hypothetical protein BC831DRAFT_456125, partial [Entophlyctis helioformis]